MIDPDVDPVGAQGVRGVCGGVDWGFSRDAHALTVIAALPERDERGRQRYWIPHLEERFALSYEQWIDRLAEVAGVLSFSVLAAETNGCGSMPSQVLARRLWETLGRDLVEPVATTSKVKEDAFGFIKLLLQQHRLVLPRHPSLLRQLSALEFSITEAGTMRIAVPERAGHDDVAMSLALAVLPLMGAELVPVVYGILDMEDLDPELADWSISLY
ncbi:MAG TPA: hypothetical protein VFP81_09690 [Propionibacteriaceae bacterium]|nr:hypothetical protein [Propionibacteriaceae bacterium]